MASLIKTWKEDGKPHGWLDEGRIQSTSYPFVLIKFGTFDLDTGAQDKSFIVSTDFQENNKEDDWSAAITSARIEGDNPIVRKAIINLTDPSGKLAVSLSEIGIAMNDPEHIGSPNVDMVFGWRNLKKDSEGETEFSESLTGLIMKSAQDLTPEGVFTTELEILEFAGAKVEITRFIDKYDMEKGLPRKVMTNIDYEDRGGGNRQTRPQSVLNYVLSEKGDFSVGRAFAASKVVYDFKGQEKSKVVNMRKMPMIRFGDSFQNYLNDMLSLVQPLGTYRRELKKRGRIATYKKQSPIFDSTTGQSTITYDWEEVIDPTADSETKDSNESPVTSEGSHNVEGPSLVWRKIFHDSNGGYNTSTSWVDARSEGEFKTLLGWTTDLASHSALLHMMGEQLDEKLSGITEEAWEDTLKYINRKGLDRAEEKARDRYNNRNVDEAVEAGGELSRRQEQAQRGMAVYEMIDEYSKEEDDDEDDPAIESLRAVVMMNAFKATATVLGDPTLGTTFEAAKTVMRTYFDNTNVAEYNLSSVIFDRVWTMFKTTHVFEEGNYTTEIQLIGIPEISPAE